MLIRAVYINLNINLNINIMKTLKWFVIVFVGLIVIAAILPSNDQKVENETGTTETPAKADIEVLKYTETLTGTMRTVHVEILNNTNKLLTSGTIKVIYENKAGNIVGTGNGSILNLAAGAKKTIDCLAMDVDGAETYRVEVTPFLYE